MGESRGARVIHQPGMGELLAQRIVDDVADSGPVARSGEAAGQAPVLERVGHGPTTGLYVSEDFNGPRQAAAQTHALLRDYPAS